MKDELFDDLLKRKLDQEDRVVTSSEIDQVHSYVRQKLSANTTFNWFRDQWFKLFSLVSFLIFLGGIFYLYQSNLDLQHKTLLLENSLKESSKQFKFMEENQKQLFQTNQILLTQNQQLQTEIRQRLQTNSANKGRNVKSLLAVNVPQNEKIEISNSQSFAKLRKIDPKRVAETAKYESGVNPYISAEETNISEIKDENNAPTIMKSEVVKSENDLTKDSQLFDSLLNAKNKTIVAKQLLDKISIDSSIKADSLFGGKQNEKWLKSMSFSAGMNGLLGLNESGGGLMTQVLINSRWQLSTGLIMSHVGGNEFEDEEDFKNEYKKDFNEIYGNKYSLSVTECRDIQFQYSLLQMPVSVSFLHPLKRNYGLMLGFGTLLNLKASESIRFQGVVQSTNKPIGHELTSVDKSVSFLSNLGFHCGFQKTWSRLTLQTMMYVNQSFEKTDIVRNLTIPGLKINLLYRFGQ